jgi:exonuclease SbcC
MTLNLAQLRERVAARFPHVEQVDDSVIRFTRDAGKEPFAVYYFDIAQDLPQTQETLTKYQDRVIGTHYFEGKTSLQWSNYLYFVTSGERLASSEVRRAKELIERDRSYARKFVITEEELDSVLAPPVIAPADAGPRTNILSLWIDHLVEAGLETAILSNDDLPRRLALIESSSPEAGAKPKSPGRSVQVSAAQSIRSLELRAFRRFPLRRSYEFGAVNLIFGPNGSGKTSLLEAIELFYCGRNKRNPTPPGAYELVVGLDDGRTEKATGSRDLQVFRDRNLTWYGQAEVKTNNLYLSFAQFNFLDTDAAVHLAESSSSRIEDDLSKLLVGQEASKTWRDIERVHEALDEKLKDLRPLEVRITEELATLENQLKAASGMKQESDSIRTRLDEMIHRLGWSGSQDEKQGIAGKIVEALSELVPLAQQAAALNWTEAPVSIDGLVKYCREAKITGEKVEPDLARLEELRKNQKRLTDAIESAHKALDLAEEAKRLIDAGVTKQTEDRGKAQSVVATYSGWLAGIDADALRVLSPADLDMNMEVCQKAATSKHSTAEALRRAGKIKYADFTKLRDQSLSLAQELREVAAKILESSMKPDECPLCHTQFGPGDLAKHMNVGVDQQAEALGQTLLNQMREQEAAVRDATSVETAAASLKKFCERASLPSDITIRSALDKVEDARRTLAQATDQLGALNKDLLMLESQGLSMGKMEEVSARLRELGFPLAELSPEATERLISTITQTSVSSSQTLEAERIQVAALQQALEASLGSAGSGIRDLQAAVSQLKERLAATDILREKLDKFSSSFPWSGTRPLAELVVEADSLRKVAGELQAALGREKQAQASYAESIKRQESLKGELGKLSPRIKRLSQAHASLGSLRKEYSLEKAMDSALQQNRVAVESIFSRIHSPAEFRGLGSTWTKLVRKTDDIEAKLTEISAGQRAAFALSVFLAQNAQLTVAPPVILIDDPIAHVDDLNSLSFLDYLRELALTGRRQIYFATANDKLATLFERKFDFLGEERFRRFDLRRETHPVPASE